MTKTHTHTHTPKMKRNVNVQEDMNKEMKQGNEKRKHLGGVWVREKSNCGRQDA